MKINIIIPYRPLSKGFMQTGGGPLYQLPDGRWKDTDGSLIFSGEHRPEKEREKDELIRAIKFINKNSYLKHNIVISVDNDVYPNNDYFKEFDNVRIVKTNYVYQGDKYTPFYRINAANVEGIQSIPDEEWLCHCYLSDLICAKHWDKPIIDAIGRYGDNHVYTPMFVEVRRGLHSATLMGMQPTPQLIWEEWRKLCCHSLTMPVPGCNYITEADMDNYVMIANGGGKPPIIMEKPGDRIYGYFNVLIMKAKFAKRAIRLIGPGFDLDIDNRLYSKCKLMKGVITRSFVFHPYCEVRW